MPRSLSAWDAKGKRFLLRLALAYLVVPVTAPMLLALEMARSTRNMQFGDWAGIVLLYAVFSFAAMVVFGAPLLVLYARLGWGGFLSFVVGGAFCAAATYLLVARGTAHRDQFVLFTLFGVVEGLLLRLILFGASRRPRAATAAS